MAVGCQAGGRVSLAPHLSREAELGPAATAGRFGVVMDRAAAFENQNQNSRDVHWYRAWRASAMLGLGQVAEAIAVLDKVLTDIASTSPAPAQADRLRVFVYDLRARAQLAQNRPADALADLERSFQLATEVELETNGDCDRSLMVASRARQIADVAALAGDSAKAESSKVSMERQLEKFSTCLAERDYPGMLVVGTLTQSLTKAPATMVAAVQAPAKVEPAPEVKKEPAKNPTKAEPKVEPKKDPAPVAANDPHQLPTTRAQYAPVDSTPWKDAIELALALAQKHAPNVKGDIVIRTDGGHHALRLRANLPKYSNPAELAPIFRATVVFFEQARSLDTKVDRVLLVVESSAGTTQLLAARTDVLELFQDRIDAAAFVKKLVRVL
jgi:hypothetical protein